MRLRLLFVALAVALLAPPGSEAAACVIVRDNDTRSPEEVVAEHRRRWDARLADRRARAAAALAGGLDPAVPLAEMLVPNIRPVPIFEYSSCGPVNEVDLGPGIETPDSLLAGTAFAGRASDFPTVMNEYEEWTPGPACNAEFRRRFSAFLRRRLSREELRASFLFLAARWTGMDVPEVTRSRFMAFASGSRQPPVRWIAAHPFDEPEFGRWTAEDRDARALRGTIDAFWLRQAGSLDDGRRACPRTAARWPVQQARIVARIEALEAARRRTPR
jgi:hypothetical protein